MKRSSLALLLIPLAAYAAKFPEDIPTAMIRFTANDAVLVMPMCERDKFIIQGLLNGGHWGKELSTVKMYGTRLDKNNEVIERLMPAERTVLFRMRWGGGSVKTLDLPTGVVTVDLHQCDRIFALTPAPGDQYHAHYELGPNSCSVRLYKLGMSGGRVQETEEGVIDDLPDTDETFKVCGEKGRRHTL